MSPERRIELRWKRLMDDAVALAMERGCQDPEIYIEAEGGMLVVDGAPHDATGSHYDRVVVHVPWPKTDYAKDVGAW